MRYRFDDIEFQLLFTDNTVGFLCVFIALYAAARLIFGKIKYKLPYFRNIRAILNNYEPGVCNRMISDEATAASNSNTGK